MMRRVRSPALAIACVIAGLLLWRAGGRGDAPDDRHGAQARRGRRRGGHGVHRVVRAREQHDLAELLPPAARRRRLRRRGRMIAAPGTTLSRPFVTVDGATVRVVSYRYGLTGARFDEIWEFTSADGGGDLRRRAPGRHRPVRRGRPRARRHADGDDQRRVHRAGGPERPARRDAPPARARPSSRPTIPTTARSGWPAPAMVARLRRRFEQRAGAHVGRRAQRRRLVDAGRRHRLRRLPAARGRPVGPLPALGHARERPDGAQVRRHHFRRRREDRRRRRRRPGAPDPGPGAGACTPSSPAAPQRASSSTTPRPTTARRWQSGPLLTQTDAIAGHRRAARGDRARSHRRGRLGDLSGASSEVRVLGIGPEGGVSPPVPGKSVAIGLVSGKVFFKSPTGRRTQLKARRDDPRRQPDRHPSSGRVELTSAATGTGATTQRSDFYQGTFTVRQSARRATARPR